MGYDIRDSSSLEALREYVQGVAAATEARPQLASEVAPWLALDDTLRLARDARDAARFAQVKAIRRYAVLRADLLSQLTRLSGAAYLAAGKDPKAPPYSTLFGRQKAEDLKDLGFNNLRDALATLLEASKAVSDEALARPLAELHAQVGPLLEAGEAKKAARRALIAHETARADLVLAVEELGDRTEAAILGKSPGRTDLVRAVLSPSLDTGRGDRKDNDEPEPQAP